MVEGTCSLKHQRVTRVECHAVHECKSSEAAKFRPQLLPVMEIADCVGKNPERCRSSHSDAENVIIKAAQLTATDSKPGHLLHPCCPRRGTQRIYLIYLVSRIRLPHRS